MCSLLDALCLALPETSTVSKSLYHKGKFTAFIIHPTALLYFYFMKRETQACTLSFQPSLSFALRPIVLLNT